MFTKTPESSSRAKMVLKRNSENCKSTAKQVKNATHASTHQTGQVKTKSDESPAECSNPSTSPQNVVVKSTFIRLKENSKFSPICELPIDQVSLAIGCTFNAYATHKVKSNNESLFSDDIEVINLQVSLIKLPIGRSYPISCALPNPYLLEESDIMVVVQDLEKGWTKDHEPTLQFYSELFARKGIKGAFEIIPLRQLRIENKPYEARNKLSKRYDAVLVDKRAAKFLPRYLGKAFYRSGKLPIIVDIQKRDLQKELNRALSTSTMSITKNGVTLRISVGRTNQTPRAIEENILAVCEKLQRKLPGHFQNIRTLSLHIGDHPWSVPLYASLATKDLVEFSNEPQKINPVIDELNTLEPGWKVAVYPGGEVKKIKDHSELTKFTKQDSENVRGGEEVISDISFHKPTRSSEESSDDEADVLEEKYLEEIEKSTGANRTDL